HVERAWIRIMQDQTSHRVDGFGHPPYGHCRAVGTHCGAGKFVGWKTRKAIFHAGRAWIHIMQNQTSHRVDGFGHPPYAGTAFAAASLAQMRCCASAWTKGSNTASTESPSSKPASACNWSGASIRRASPSTAMGLRCL